jgi:16S rRNA (guanine966-N2)-methyltransferase
VRIVGGELSGRVFSGPGGDRTRPTSERVREGLFSALEARDAIDGARVLDAYAGTAALAFEALSRGAVSALSVERDARNIKAIGGDARSLGLSARHRALQLDLERSLDRLGPEPFDLILCDPPWADLARAIHVLAKLVATRLAPSGTVVLIHAARDRHPDLAGVAIDADYRYGDTAAVIYAAPSAPAPPVEGTRDDEDLVAEAKAT